MENQNRVNEATNRIKNMGYGKVFVRENGEICLTNRSRKVVLTMNKDYTVKYSRNNMDSVVTAIKDALTSEATSVAGNGRKVSEDGTVDSGLGFYMQDTKRNWAICAKMGYDAIEHTN